MSAPATGVQRCDKGCPWRNAARCPQHIDVAVPTPAVVAPAARPGRYERPTWLADAEDEP